MATMNGVIEDSTGYLLRAGFQTFTAGDGESVRSDVPVPPYVKYGPGLTQVHQWDGTDWNLVAQPTKPLHGCCGAGPVGSIEFADGESEKSVTFDTPFENVPKVIVTIDITADIQYAAVKDVTATGFTCVRSDSTGIVIAYWFARCNG